MFDNFEVQQSALDLEDTNSKKFSEGIKKIQEEIAKIKENANRPKIFLSTEVPTHFNVIREGHFGEIEINE